MIERITDKDRKEHIARLILLALPEWFGIPESTRAYIEACRELPFGPRSRMEMPSGIWP